MVAVNHHHNTKGMLLAASASFRRQRYDPATPIDDTSKNYFNLDK